MASSITIKVIDEAAKQSQTFEMSRDYIPYSDIIQGVVDDMGEDVAEIPLYCEPEAFRRLLVLMRYLTSIAKPEDIKDHADARIIFAYTEEQRQTVENILGDYQFVLEPASEAGTPRPLTIESFEDPKYHGEDAVESERLKKQDTFAYMMTVANYLGWPFGIDACGVCTNYWIFDKLTPEQLAAIIAAQDELDKATSQLSIADD